MDEVDAHKTLVAGYIQKNLTLINIPSMKIKKGFTLHQVGDEYIIMQSGTGNVDFSNIISLNPTAARLWKSVEGKEFDVEMLTIYLTEHYEVEADTAACDARQVIKDWLKTGIIE